MLAIGLAGSYIALERPRVERGSRPIGLEAVTVLAAWSVAVLAVWWVAAAGSPLLAWSGFDPDAYRPMATASAALGVVLMGRWLVARPSGVLPPADRGELVAFTSGMGSGLGLASAYLMVWSSGRVGLATLALATTASGLLAMGGWKRVDSAIQGGLTWCLAWPMALVLAARATGRVAEVEMPSVAAIGLVLAVFGLWWAAGRVRRRDEGEGEGDGGAGPGVGPSRAGRVALAMEWVSIAATVPAALGTLAEGGASARLATVVLIGLAVFYAMVARRSGSEWPAYLAQAFVLAGYFRARPSMGLPDGVDAVVLSMLAYLDLGISELMGRLRWAPFARPTLRFAMALPLVPILQGAWQERLDGVGLFILMATAGFYALAAFRLRSRAPAYAAVVLLNAFLWLGWWILGWRMAESPQFYLIPVGFSMILFAEVNRQELDRSIVNGSRSLGLMVIYASLAAPIWQAQSFGAWLALLLLSLAGIFAGIGLRVQSFLWLGLACFVADLVYQLGRLGIDHALARWAVMLSLGVALILFVALNEKKKIVATIKGYYDEARGWE